MFFVRSKIKTKQEMKKDYLWIAVIGFISGIGGAFTFEQFSTEKSTYQNLENYNYPANLVSHSANYEPAHQAEPARALIAENFVEASSSSTNSVVYIKNISATGHGYSWMDYFFGERAGQRISSGSGVIYSADGYVITNHHVVADAEKIEVMHNKRNYPAQLIGTDPSTDLAVLKIEARNLPAIKIGSSASLNVGEWVLAVGNPFNLTSTVTAGIVSAKGREINILQSDFPIESFIQTDAAINPGNSGGALVNSKGELVGINTAILSKTGSYAGYGFAVPVDIVSKIADDIIEYGEVQKAFLGAEVVDVNQQIADKLGIEEITGVVINYIEKNGAAEKAGLAKGDIIVAVDRMPIDGKSTFEERISYHSPGDKIQLSYKRNDKINTTSLELTNRIGSTSIIRREIYQSKPLGARLETIPDEEKQLLNLNNGVRIGSVQSGLMEKLGIQEGFIITKINNSEINNPSELEKILTSIRGRVIIEGMNKKGVRGYYSYYF
jgi:Do/DeqQ family serine protease